MQRIIGGFGLLAAFCIAANAADENGAAAIKGAGQVSCSTYTETVSGQQQQALQFVGWVEGYVTAINVLQDGTFDMAPWQDSLFLATLLQRHCNDNPDEPFHVAVLKLIRTFSPQRLAEQSETISVSHDGQEVRVYEAVLKRVQNVLINKGILAGPADGIYGAYTQEAISAYQAGAGLPQTGLPDTATLRRLFFEEPLAAEAQKAQEQGQ